MIVLFAVLIHIGLLVILKYTGFFGENINNLLALFNTDFRFKIPKICIPIGISFYTLQGLSYIFDVYKGKQIEAGKKSVSFSIRMRSHEATLTDEQADRAMQRALKALNAIGAQLRES